MKVIDLGTMGYKAAWDDQLSAVETVLGGGQDILFLVEHPPVLTLGASFHEKNLLLPVAEYEHKGIDVIRTDRGGDVTFHGPGQLVIYPVFDLSRHGRDLHLWLRNLEEAIILTLSKFGITGFRFPPHTGVWVNEPPLRAEKIAAIGIKIRRWVSLHGIALNCSNTMEEFELIVPCGIHGYGVTSLSQVLGRPVSVKETKEVVIEAFRNTFHG